MLNDDSSNQDRRVERILSAIKQEYVIVGRSRVKTWHAWLLIGIAAGVAAGIVLVANRSGEVEQGRAATNDAIAISVELDLPSYYPDFLRHPQKFFSGQPLKIIAPAFPDHGVITLADIATGKQQSVTAKQSRERPGKAEIAGKTSFSFMPPADLATGQYRISFAAGGRTYEIQLAINGLTAAEKDISGAITIPDLFQRIAIRYRTKICDGCFWEMVFAGARDNSQALIHSYAGSLLSRSSDGGRTWSESNINDIAAYPRSGVSYGGDSKAMVENNGSFFLSSLMWTTLRGSNELGGVLYGGSSTGGLTASIFKDVSLSASTSTWLFVDYPKLAYDPRISAVYISGNAVWFDATGRQGYGLFVSQDDGKTFAEYELQYNGVAFNSMALDENGKLYAGTSNTRSGTFGPTLFRFVSITPPAIESFDIPGSYSFWGPRISKNSDRWWSAYQGPEIIIDTSPTSSHYGRLYAVWAQEEKVVSDPDFEFPYYGYNFDVFVSFSDDKGQTWSPKAKVNDDSGGGDQFFPSARVSSDGILHIAFVDHRNWQKYPVFDIYYAKSSDGVKFSTNLRVNVGSIANNPVGGRTIGDYLDMVAAYPDRVYIAYPCGQSDSGPTGACMAQVDPRMVR